MVYVHIKIVDGQRQREYSINTSATHKVVIELTEQQTSVGIHADYEHDCLQHARPAASAHSDGTSDFQPSSQPCDTTSSCQYCNHLPPAFTVARNSADVPSPGLQDYGDSPTAYAHQLPATSDNESSMAHPPMIVQDQRDWASRLRSRMSTIPSSCTKLLRRLSTTGHRTRRQADPLYDCHCGALPPGEAAEEPRGVADSPYYCNCGDCEECDAYAAYDSYAAQDHDHYLDDPFLDDAGWNEYALRDNTARDEAYYADDGCDCDDCAYQAYCNERCDAAARRDRVRYARRSKAGRRKWRRVRMRTSVFQRM